MKRCCEQASRVPKPIWLLERLPCKMMSVVENLNGVGTRTKDKYARVYSKDFEATLSTVLDMRTKRRRSCGPQSIEH